MSIHEPERDELAELVLHALDGTIDDDQTRRLGELIESGPDMKQAYFDLIKTHIAVMWQVNGAAADDPYARSVELLTPAVSSPPTVDSPGDLLKALAGIEPDKATPVDIDQEIARLHAESAREKEHVSRQDLGVVAVYVFREALHAKQTWIGLAAAVVLLAVFLFVPFGGGQEPGGGLAVHPETHTDPATPAATITAERDAVWDGHPGETLRPGQRLKLTRGFAEITTARGAIALLEAPATVEIMDHDNAIRLHTGRLVARCETLSSKGYTVFTPSARVVDLSTAFGLAVDADGSLEVHVLEGEIALSPTLEDGTAGESVLMKHNEARWVSSDGRRVEVIDPAPQRFVRSLDDPAQIYARKVRSLNPVAYYRFESAVDGEVANTAGDRYPAKVHGPVSLVQTASGHAARLAAIEDRPAYLELDQPIAELRGAPRYTLECWARPATRDPGALIAFMDARPDREPTAASTLQFNRPSGKSQSYIRFSHRNPPSNGSLGGTEAAADPDYQPGEWVHLAAVVSPEDARLYVNGRLVDTRPAPDPMADVPLSTLLGAAHPALAMAQRRQFNGLIDEVAIYADALSKQDIAYHHRLMRRALEIE